MVEKEFPAGYAEAYKKHLIDPKTESLETIWVNLKRWREDEKGSLFENLKGDPRAYTLLINGARELIAIFQARILRAVLENDSIYLSKLLRVLKEPLPRTTAVTGIEAALQAFREFSSVGFNRFSREDWPTKQEVRRRAEKILTQAGQPLPSERHWPRIFIEAGLKDLLSVKYGRAHKRREASPRTK